MAARALFAAAALMLAQAVAADPRIDYLLYCAGCHRVDGAGVPPDVPSLIDTPGRMVATRAGRDYLVRVPGAAQAALSDAELAAVVNWVLAEFNAATLPVDFKPLQEGEVSKARRRVLADPRRYRAETWPDLGGYPANH
jgi:mono/diheme cytochrome c family protein